MLTASSTHTLPRFSPARSRLHTPPVNEGDTEYEILAGGWAAAASNNPQWLQAEFQESHYINTVATQGRDVTSTLQWVTAYSLQYGNTEYDFVYILDSDRNVRVFEGNFDRNTVVTNTFDPVNARMVRLNVVEFHGFTRMRWELYACV